MACFSYIVIESTNIYDVINIFVCGYTMYHNCVRITIAISTGETLPESACLPMLLFESQRYCYQVTAPARHLVANTHAL